MTVPAIRPRQSRRWPLVLTAAALVALVVVAVGVTGGGGSGSPPAAPALVLPSLGRPLDLWRLSDQRGTDVVLNFWASWCVPCRTEMPELDALQARTVGQLSVIGVNTSDQDAAAEDFLRETAVSYRLVTDRDGSAARSYAVTTLPTTMLIDAEGRVVMRIVGRPDAEELDRLVAQYLGEDRRDGPALTDRPAGTTAQP